MSRAGRIDTGMTVTVGREQLRALVVQALFVVQVIENLAGSTGPALTDALDQAAMEIGAASGLAEPRYLTRDGEVAPRWQEIEDEVRELVDRMFTVRKPVAS